MEKACHILEKVFANFISDRGRVSRVCKELSKFISRKRDTYLIFGITFE